jgi:hypothetical protein
MLQNLVVYVTQRKMSVHVLIVAFAFVLENFRKKERKERTRLRPVAVEVVRQMDRARS